jgi:hypothetical protein
MGAAPCAVFLAYAKKLALPAGVVNAFCFGMTLGL